MNSILKEKLDNVGLIIPNILLPAKNIDYKKFSVIAADQFTQNLEYWKSVKEYVKDEPSTLNLIYPEAIMEFEKEKYQNNFDTLLKNRINSIINNMNNYVANKIYNDIGKCFIYVERTYKGKKRKGLIVAVDLEKYDYAPNSKSLIRPTELTVKERLVVRTKIREKATIDLSHVLLLINDKNNNLFNKIIDKVNYNNILYNFDLMENGGHIKGYKIDDENEINDILDVLINLKNESNDGMLYAVGDGNHSLAAAKDSYLKNKIGRYAIVEITNIYDDGITFYPIHRLIMNVDREKFYNETGLSKNNSLSLQETQKILDKFNYKIDYIHGINECEELGKKPNNVAITFNRFSYETLFNDVIKNGSLCRKSFSIGEAYEKRYYLEATKIV